MLEQNDLFEELSVIELEERLELVNRCLCRIAKDTPVVAPASANG